MNDNAELTDDQAAELAKWLSLPYENHRNILLTPDGNGVMHILQVWLDSAEGERALSNKCEQCFIRQEHWPASENAIIYKLTSNSFDWLPHKNVYSQSRESTRTRALQLACLKAISGER